MSRRTQAAPTSVPSLARDHAEVAGAPVAVDVVRRARDRRGRGAAAGRCPAGRTARGTASPAGTARPPPSPPAPRSPLAHRRSLAGSFRARLEVALTPRTRPETSGRGVTVVRWQAGCVTGAAAPSARRSTGLMRRCAECGQGFTFSRLVAIGTNAPERAPEVQDELDRLMAVNPRDDRMFEGATVPRLRARRPVDRPALDRRLWMVERRDEPSGRRVRRPGRPPCGVRAHRHEPTPADRRDDATRAPPRPDVPGQRPRGAPLARDRRHA